MIRNQKVRIAGVATESVVDGPGLRSVIFFQGCPHACPGCHNPETWDPRGGHAYPLGEVIAQLKLNPLIQGVTLSGGEPFLQAGPVAVLAEFLKARGYNLWIYTGYVWEELIQRLHEPAIKKILKNADVLVDGPFSEKARDLQLAFRGSTNQRLIRVHESMEQGKIINWVPAWQ